MAPALNAATRTWDFNTDPGDEIVFGGTTDATTGAFLTRYVATGGATGGYLSITDAANDRSGTALFPDIDANAPVTGFDLTAKLRISDGTARPADGMSINWIPVGGDQAFGASAAEEGVVTGIAISLDMWDNNGTDTGPSIEVKSDQRIGGTPAYSAGQREGGRAHFGPLTTDIRTGAAFETLRAVYKNSFMTVSYKGTEIIKNAYVPAATVEPRQLFMAARTGNANENHWVDDVTLTTFTAAAASVTRVSPDPRLPTGMAGSTALDTTIAANTNIEVDIRDGTTAPLVNSSVSMTVDGTAVPAASLTFAKTDTTTTVTYNPPTDFAPASKHTVVLTFGTGVGAATESINFEFYITPFNATTLFIEAEDFNFDGGQHKTEADSVDYAGAAYAGLTATAGIDYNDPGTVENAAYRTDVSVSMAAHGEVTRFDHDITENYKVGWNDAGDWFNYTRVFAPGAYKVYSRNSSDGADIATKLSLVSGAATTDQTVVDLGTFVAGESNGWDTFRTIALKDGAGQDVVLNLNGEQTVRVTINPGATDINYLAFVPVPGGGGVPAIASLNPANNGVVSPTAPFQIVGTVLDQSVVVPVNSLTMTVNGTPVTDVPTKTGAFSRLAHDMPAPGYGAVYTVVFSWTENGAAKSLTHTIRSGGGVTRRLYTGLSTTSQSLQDIFDAPAYIDNAPDVESVAQWYETQPDILEGYGIHLIGYIEPTVTADYTFTLSSDDNGVLYLSTDDKAVNKRSIARQVNWSGYRDWTGDPDGGGNPLANRRSAPIRLEAGKRYYTEALAKEGGGGDNLSIAWTKPGDAPLVNGAPPITFEMRPFTGLDFDVVPQSRTVKQGVPITLTSHVVAGPGGPITYQWFKGAAEVTGATSATLDLGPAAVSMNGDYTVRATLTPTAGGAPIVATSAPAATITVIADAVAPVLTSVTVVDLADLIVRFDEPVPTAPVFTISGGVTVIDAALSPNPANETAWKVHTSPLTPDTTYTLTATGVKDYAGNTATLTKQFTPRLLGGYARWETFQNIGGGAITDLTGNAKFPDFPDQKEYRPEFQAPSDIMDNFGTKLSGYFIPPSNGDYVFFFSSDDQGALYLSTDEDPANKKQIAAENQWSGTREWVTSGNTTADLTGKRSDQYTGTEWPTGNTITLVAGRRYYIESLSKEGGGGDNNGATWKLASAVDPANGAASLQGAALAVVADPVISISGPANNTSITAGTATTITSTIQSSAGAAKVEYFANGTKLGESTTDPFSFTVPGAAIVPGRYALTARVTDVVGNTFTSQPVIVLVRPSTPGAKKILFLHATAGPNAHDITVINRLFGRGFDVYPMAGNASSTASAAGMDLVVISSTLPSADAGAKFRDVTIPVLTWEASIQDDMLFTLNVDGTDRGTTGGLTTVTVQAAGAAHPIGAGVAAGDVVIANTGTDFSWGLPAASAVTIAKIQNEANRHALYAFETGAVLIDGTSTAKGRRVFFPMSDNTFNNLNATGQKLFDQSIDWLLAGGGGNPSQPQITITKTATTIEISWTNGGTLYSSPTVDGVFSTVVDTASPYSETIPAGAAMKFYTVKVLP